MNKLEQSFADLRTQHNLSRIDIGLSERGFNATAWWSGFSNSGCTCAFGRGDSILEAINDVLRCVAQDRAAAVGGLDTRESLTAEVA